MGKAATYHKENLRRDLLVAARDHVTRQGHLSLSLRGLALQVGVTTGAPYHHFADKRSLLLEVAVEGFTELIGSANAIADASWPALKKLMAVGEAFVGFANSNPRMLELMYESELTTPVLDPTLHGYQHAGYENLVAILRESEIELDDRELNLRAITFWSTIYGYALIRNKLRHRPHDLFNETADEVDRLVILEAVKNALMP